MLLDLYITHWTEPWEVCRPGFEMLKNQRCVDWKQVRVTLVHDGTEKFPVGYFGGYPCKIRQVKIPHRGIAGVRNWILDDAKATWIKMNDCDDFFTGAYSLKELMHGLEVAGDRFDMMWFDVYAEMHGRRYIKDVRDPVVLHGKAIRTRFLRDHGIRFQEDLTWCEDSAFLALLEMEIDARRIGKITGSSPIYTWIHRYGSLCNRPEIRYQNLQSFFRRHCYVAEEFRKHGLMDGYCTMVARIACDSYYTLQVADIKEDRSEHEKRVYEYLKEHREQLYGCRKSAFQEVVDATNRENDNCNITGEEVRTWLRALKDKYEGLGEQQHGEGDGVPV